MPAAIESPKLLLVEGSHEIAFFGKLLDELAIGDVQPYQVGGDTFFRPNLETLQSDANWSSVISLGIVRDADESFAAKFQSIRDTLNNVGLPVPEEPIEPAGASPEVRVFIMPDNQSQGSLEDLCMSTLPPSAVLDCLDTYFDCLELAQGHHPHLAKARVQAYLASKPAGNVHMGVAAQRGYWDLDSDRIERLRGFIHNL